MVNSLHGLANNANNGDKCKFRISEVTTVKLRIFKSDFKEFLVLQSR